MFIWNALGKQHSIVVILCFSRMSMGLRRLTPCWVFVYLPQTSHKQMVLPLDSDFIPGPLQWNAALVRDTDVYAQHWSVLANGSNVLVLNAIDTNKTLPDLHEHHTWARRVLQYGAHMCQEW